MLEKELKKKLEGVPVKGIYPHKMCGDMIVYDDYSEEDGKYTVEFKETGYIVRSTLKSIRRGNVRDRLYKNIFGVGAIGYASIYDDKKAITLWRNILSKCYDPKDKVYYKYGAQGFTVCERWLRFDLFLEDYKKIAQPDTEGGLHFVIKQKLLDAGIKEYAPENCEYISNLANLDYDKIYHSNGCGDFRVIGRKRDRKNKLKFIIKFELTGYETLVTKGDVLLGRIYDPFYPRVCGVGYMGGIGFEFINREYDTWNDMIGRCYDTNNIMYKSYGGKGVTVDPEWFSFKNFLRDFRQMENYELWRDNPGMYQFDKDKKQFCLPTNQKIYSKYTCSIISREENARYRYLELINEDKMYHGIFQIPNGKWIASISVNGVKMQIGTFDCPEAACNARDWYCELYGGTRLLNRDIGIPYMPPEEWVRHRCLGVGKKHKQLYKLKPRQLYHLINKEEDNGESNEDNNEG